MISVEQTNTFNEPNKVKGKYTLFELRFNIRFYTLLTSIVRIGTNITYKIQYIDDVVIPFT